MNDQLYICCFFFMIFLFLILLSPQWNSMHWLGDPKNNKKNKKQKKKKQWQQSNGEVSCASQIAHHTHAHTRVTAFIPLVPLPQVHEPTPTSSPPAVQPCAEGSTQTHACKSPHSHRFMHSALSLLSFLIGQTRWRHLMTSHICTKWLVFVYLSNYQGVLLWEKC